jgi:hypothetical protein
MATQRLLNEGLNVAREAGCVVDEIAMYAAWDAIRAQYDVCLPNMPNAERTRYEELLSQAERIAPMDSDTVPEHVASGILHVHSNDDEPVAACNCKSECECEKQSATRPQFQLERNLEKSLEEVLFELSEALESRSYPTATRVASV